MDDPAYKWLFSRPGMVRDLLLGLLVGLRARGLRRLLCLLGLLLRLPERGLRRLACGLGLGRLPRRLDSGLLGRRRLLGLGQTRFVRPNRRQTGPAERVGHPLGGHRQGRARRGGALDDHPRRLAAVVEQRRAVPPLSRQRVVQDRGRVRRTGGFDAADAAAPDHDLAGVVQRGAVDRPSRFRRVPRERIRRRRRVGRDAQQRQAGNGVVRHPLRGVLVLGHAHHEVRPGDEIGVVRDHVRHHVSRAVGHEAEQMHAVAGVPRPPDGGQRFRAGRLSLRRRGHRQQQAACDGRPHPSRHHPPPRRGPILEALPPTGSRVRYPKRESSRLYAGSSIEPHHTARTVRRRERREAASGRLERDSDW